MGVLSHCTLRGESKVYTERKKLHLSKRSLENSRGALGARSIELGHPWDSSSSASAPAAVAHCRGPWLNYHMEPLASSAGTMLCAHVSFLAKCK